MCHKAKTKKSPSGFIFSKVIFFIFLSIKGVSLKDKNYFFAFACAAALTITANASAFSEAPPTNAPSMSG